MKFIHTKIDILVRKILLKDILIQNLSIILLNHQNVISAVTKLQKCM
jgi:hypothetical protein